ncbi:hypothetical protein TRAPUB_13308 [Trametes pubescens]|uniref:Uncharacterized protein n=1 Tax=Trametes pubescens TaxID=154538 RepID=A0A1M2VRI8_TRAPU|nr:hypothetical protein TRAPUB_13308 [Trametes pubescens]
MSIFHLVFTLIEATILVSRFLLNLREVDSSRSSSDLDTISFPTFAPQPMESDNDTPDFVASFIGPLGAPLDYAPILQDDASITTSPEASDG